MLSHSELDIGVSDASIETMKSDDCREMSRSDGNTNSVVVMMLWNSRTLTIFILFFLLFF